MLRHFYHKRRGTKEFLGRFSAATRTVLTIGILLFLATLDYIRSRVFAILGERMAIRLGASVLSAAVATSLRNHAGVASQAVRDLQDLRQFITSGPVGLPIDLLIAPLFLAVLFLLHPAYGLVGLGAALYLGAIGILVGMAVAGTLHGSGRRRTAAGQGPAAGQDAAAQDVGRAGGRSDARRARQAR
jgi:ATP-binding cassette subfamily C protein